MNKASPEQMSGFVNALLDEADRQHEVLRKEKAAEETSDNS
jgi:hypothetical protein